MKAKEEDLLEEISKYLPSFLKQGGFANLDSIAQKLELKISKFKYLLRIHFILTRGESKKQQQNTNGVIPFIKDLKKRIRRIKTNVKKKREEFRGKVVGRVNWEHTVQRRYQRNFNDFSLFICERRERNYEIQENLVLKELLRIIFSIVKNDLVPVFEKKSNYQWLSGWITDKKEKDLRDILTNVFKRNIYLRRIELEEISITPRMINRAKRSRNKLYREAGYLMERYRKLMRYELDNEEANKLLRNTFIKPDKTEVLFELYWVLKIFKQFEKKGERMKLHLLKPGDDNNMVAKWEKNKKVYELYHNSQGPLRFLEQEGDFNEPEGDDDGFLKREIKVLRTINEMLGKKKIWGGRPDILLIVSKSEYGTKKLESLFIGEVKYTSYSSYAIQGLRELLEYIALVRKSREINIEGSNQEDHIVGECDDLFSNMDFIKGGLFVDKIDDFEVEAKTISDGKIKIYQFNPNQDFEFPNL